MRKFTAQEVITMGAKLYDNEGFSRFEIRTFLDTLVEHELADIDVNRAFDLIVG